jgi:hypothetical protein
LKHFIKIPSLILLAGLMYAATGPHTQTRPMDSMTAKDWIADLEFLAAELPKRHKNLFFKLDEHRFQEMTDNLKATISNLKREEIIVEIMKILAAVGDAHTDTYIRPLKALPLMLYWFDDGIHILNTTEDYKAALYGRITGLGDSSIEEVINTLSQIIPHENKAQIKNKLPSFLTNTGILFGLGLIPDTSEAKLSFQDREGKKRTIEMKPVSMSKQPAWLVNTRDTTLAPLYRQKAGEYYWSQYLEETETLFFKYNSCRQITTLPFAQFTKEVFYLIDTKDIRRLVIDLRHNGGGNSGIFTPFLAEIKKRESINRKGGLYVLIGRRTFSSAVLNALLLKNQTAALFAGEPTGGKPNHFGEIKHFQLPLSKIPIQYSTKYFTIAKEDTPSLLPDIPVTVNFSDYLDNVDPVLQAILNR